MKEKYFLFFIGTTAELIKLAPLIREFKKQKIRFKVLSSGQNVLNFDELGLDPKNDLDFYKVKLKKHRLSNIYLEFLLWMIKVFINYVLYLNNHTKNISKKNIYIIVHGDTISSLLGSLIAKINRCKLIHVESGLRSFNFLEPFPEEICRFAVSLLANYHFCPNQWAVNNLKKYPGIKINTFNNTSIEALENITKFPRKEKLISGNYFILVVHRQENILFNTKRSIKIIQIFTEYASSKNKCVIILHKLTQKFLYDQGLMKSLQKNKNILLIPRLPYQEFIELLGNSQFIATDGGSNQEEAYYLGKPCLILRNTTERIEGLKENTILSKNDFKVIKKFTQEYRKYRRKPIKITTPPSEIITKFVSGEL